MKWYSDEVQRLRVTLHFLDDTILAVKHGEGGAQETHPVALADVAGALAGVSLGSGLLPDGALFWQRVAGQEQIGVYVPPRRWAVTVRLGKTDAAAWTVPMPPLVWVGCGQKYSLWALKGRPPAGERDVPLWRAPAPNVTASDGVCAGTVQFPACAPHTIHTALDMFFASEFNTHAGDNRCRSYPSVVDLWRALDGRQRFPLGELVPARKMLAQVMEKQRHDD